MTSIVNLSIGGTYGLLLVFGLLMLVVTYLFARWQKVSSVEGFLVGRRQVNWVLGSKWPCRAFLVRGSKHSCVGVVCRFGSNNQKENAVWVHSPTVDPL